MLSTTVRRSLLALAIVLAGATTAVQADSAKGKFYRAFYLEQADGDWSAAADLYEEVAGDDRADRKLRAQAEARLGACREELASHDFARLMPPDAWAYVEVNRPGDQVLKLLAQLGLLADPDQVVSEGMRRLGVSPALVKEVLGVGGAAVAITGFDPLKQAPRGVLVFHPGNLEMIRGAIETGLPVGGTAVEPIGGFATYNVEGEALVTLTSRLVIVSTERGPIEGVVKRLRGEEERSLATNRAIKEIVENREDALLLFFVNAKPMMPMLMGAMAAGAMASPELATAQALLDLDSLHSLMGRVGVGDDGLFLDVGLRLDEGHHNLVYNLLRTPAINPETLKCVPEGAAAVWVGALNEAGSRYTSGSGAGADEAPIVTLLDFGREIFANITSIALFALPPEGEASEGGPPVPDVAAAITVNDPSQSQALWTTVLGIAGMATGLSPIEGSSIDMDGLDVRRYGLPEGVTIYFTTVGNDVLISSSKSAMARTILAKRKGKSILNDKVFTAAMSRMSEDTTKALFLHAGRCAEIAKRFMPPHELEEAAPFMHLLSDTVASVVVEHSGEVFRFSTLLTGIPDVGDLVAQMITEEVRKEQQGAQFKHAMRTGEWGDALTAVDEQLRDQPGNIGLLRAKFKVLAVGQKDREAATALGEAILENAGNTATTLNNFAWALLTEDQYGDAYDELALKMSKRSNELTDYKSWMFLDTLALAKFKTGDAQGAVTLQKKAIEHCGGQGMDGLKQALARFEAGLSENE